jgi:hypothetical protein
VASITTRTQIHGRDFCPWIGELAPLREAPDHLHAIMAGCSRDARQMRDPPDYEIGRHARGAFLIGVGNEGGEHAPSLMKGDAEVTSEGEIVLHRTMEGRHWPPSPGHGCAKRRRRAMSTFA